MDKKLFGIKLSTYLQLVVCVIIAFCVWFFAKYIETSQIEETVSGFLTGIDCL